MTTTNNAAHPFERAGLGVAPFKIIGIRSESYQACPGAPIQPGAACDYCAQGIHQQVWILSADGRRFKVGMDCAERTEDRGFRRVISAEKKKKARIRREAKAKAVEAELTEMMANESTREALRAMAHPRGFTNRETGEALTMLDQVEWMMERAGATGRAKVLKEIKAALG